MAHPDTSMVGKTCLVTGATAGIGEVTAREFARRGTRVVILGRSRERCAATTEALNATKTLFASERLSHRPVNPHVVS